MRKILIGVGIGLGVLFVLLHFGARWAESKIEKEIESVSFLTYDSLDIDVIDRSLEIYNLRGSKDGYEGEVDILKIQGLRLLPILTGKKFVIKKVLVSGVNFNYQLDAKKSKESEPDNKTGKENVPEFEIKSVELEEGFFTLSDRNDSLIFNTQLAVVLENLTNQDISRPSEIPGKLIRLNADSAQFISADRLYRVSIDKSVFNNETAVLRDVIVKCELGKFELARHIGHEIDWFNASVDSILLKVTDLKSVLKTPQFDRMDVFRPSLHVFRDKRLPFPENHFPRLLRDALADEDLQFAFDSVRVTNGEFKYEEFVKEEKGPGILALHRLDADITNLRSFSLEPTERARLIATCSLYDKAQLFADISFPKSKDENQTRVKGKLMPIDLTELNQMIRYVSVIEIKSGKSKMLEFDFSYTDTEATGEMKFAYNDLAIEFLEKQEAEPDGVISAVKSFFVNSFVIDRNNDFESEKFRVGKINFERAEEKSMFNYWWGSILTGFKSSTGVDTSGEKIDVN